MENKQIGMLAGVVGLLSIGVQYVPSFALAGLANGGGSSILPMIEPVGQSVALYQLLANIAGPLITFMLAVGLGYYLSGRVDITREYRRVGSLVAIGSSTAVGTVFFIGAIVSVSNGGSFSVLGLPIVLLVGSVVMMLVVVAVPITVGALAGAAVAHFQAVEKTPSRPTESDTNAPINSGSGPQHDDPRSQSQSSR